MKKFCAVLLVLLMVLSSMPLMASATAENTVIIYYNNDSFTTPYIHYGVAGSWTTVPGVKMDAATDQQGYTYKYMINIGTCSAISFCFNDGNGHWDSKNGANYNLSGLQGYEIYGVKNQTLTKLAQPGEALSVTSFTTSINSSNAYTNDKFTVTAKAEKGTAPYQYKFGYKNTDGTITDLTNYSSSNSAEISIPDEGTKTLCALVKDANGVVAEKDDSSLNFVDNVSVYNMKLSKDTVTAGETMYIYSGWDGGYHPISFKYSYSYEGGEKTTISDYSSYTGKDGTSYASFTPAKAGTYTIYVDIKDANSDTNSKIATETKTLTVKEKDTFSIDAQLSADTILSTNPSITVNSTAKNNTGDVKFKVSFGFSSGTGGGIVHGYELSTTGKDSTTFDLWNIPGKYAITVDALDSAGNSATVTKYVTVEAPKVSNTITMYYNNASYANAYMHYRAGSGAWTTAPGVKMAASSEQSGYTYKYTVDLGTATTFTCCFNNGNGSWDSKNGANYTVSNISGNVIYGVKDGTVSNLADSKKLSVVASVDDTTLTTNDTYIKVAGVTSNAVGAVSTKISYTVNGTTTVVMDYTKDYCGDDFSLPTVAGTYIITVDVKDSTGAVATDSKTVTVTDPKQSNKITVYYMGLSNAYIHYRVGNGAWTTVPGVKMDSISPHTGYLYAYAIDLGTADTFTCCFNDGNNNWDSNNGSNYTISGISGTVTYGIKNNTITKM